MRKLINFFACFSATIFHSFICLKLLNGNPSILDFVVSLFFLASAIMTFISLFSVRMLNYIHNLNIKEILLLKIDKKFNMI